MKLTTTRSRLAAGVALTMTALGALTACGGGADEAGTDKLHIVGFAVPEAANDAIYQEFRETDEGESLVAAPVDSYGPSGDQSRAVASGLKADYVHFSVASDVTRLVDEGLVAEDWNAGENKGVVSRSIVVFGVREGNPKNITTWEDLVKPGIEIVTPNPGSSGAARWNALAAYGQVVANGGSEADAKAYTDKFFGNVVAMPGSGRDATQAFLGGTGDVLMAYENEAILSNQSGKGFEYLIPETTLLIENPGAVVKDAPEYATKWLDFVLSDAGQKQFALKGFRPIRDDVDFGGEVKGAADPKNPFPPVTNLLTVDKDFGSWSELSTKFFDEKSGLVTESIKNSFKGKAK